MSRRIYWLLPDLASARRTMNDLLLARVSEGYIHFVARDGVDTTGLHVANVLQTSDVLRSAQVGLVIGGLTGALAGGIAALFFPIVGEVSGLAALQAVMSLPQWGAKEVLMALDTPQWGAAGLLALFGGALGAWSASLIGVSTPSHRLRRFKEAIAQGQLLLMVDVPRSRVEEIEALLGKTHPEARFEGVEPDMPAFP